MVNQVPADWQDKVMHGSVTVGGQVLMGGAVRHGGGSVRNCTYRRPRSLVAAHLVARARPSN
jgi:uncharacterized glyoxalase superfamily protein PhnB